MENQEKTCCMGMKHHRKWIIVKIIILLIGMAIGLAIGLHHRGGRGFENGRFGMMGNTIVSQRGGMMKGNFERQNINQLSTGDQQKQTLLKQQMNEMTALQDNYTSMISFIQRGDTTNAGQRIDQLMTELTQLKTDLPNIVTSVNK